MTRASPWRAANATRIARPAMLSTMPIPWMTLLASSSPKLIGGDATRDVACMGAPCPRAPLKKLGTRS
ncbi:MAG: hypothetical protein WDW38_007467 [Sanguina aurantia]